MASLRTKRRSAYTLLEILLVVFLVVIIASISVPLMQTMLGNAGIAGAGDAIRGQVAEARARAMDESRPWKLAILENTGIYQLAPEESAEWTGAASQELVEKPDLIRGAIPEGIIFALREEAIFPNETLGGVGDGWKTVAVFMPDGSARFDDAAVDEGIIYFGQPGIIPSRLKVRGLTGAGSIETGRPKAGQ